LIAARLDLLDPDLRSLVSAASVLGDTFPAEAVASVTGQPIDVARNRLASLLSRNLFTVSADRLSPQRGSFAFSHELVRRVAFETLSRRDRKVLHLAVADHLRAAFAADGEEVSAAIARHLLDPLDAVPGDSDVEELRGRAVAALERAATRARRT